MFPSHGPMLIGTVLNILLYGAWYSVRMDATADGVSRYITHADVLLRLEVQAGPMDPQDLGTPVTGCFQNDLSPDARSL